MSFPSIRCCANSCQHRQENTNLTVVKADLQDVASFEETLETLALLKILALGTQDVAAVKVKPVAEVAARLRAKRATV